MIGLDCCDKRFVFVIQKAIIISVRFCRTKTAHDSRDLNVLPGLSFLHFLSHHLWHDGVMV